MKNTINILETLQNILGAKLSHLLEPCKGYWAHTGKFSITNLSRWTLSMSKRRLERFYARPHDWVSYNGTLVYDFLSRFKDVFERFSSNALGWALTIDETVEKKQGKSTYGRGFHYSSKADKVIGSIAVMNLSLTHCGTKLSLPLAQEQMVFPSEVTADQAVKKAAKKAQKKAAQARQKALLRGETPPPPPESTGKVGRPKGSKNKPKPDKDAENPAIAYTFCVLQLLLGIFLKRLAPLLSTFIAVRYVIGDGGFGNNTVAKICQSLGFELISRLQYNAALYLPFKGDYAGKGRPPKYGDKIDYNRIDEQLKDYLVEKKIHKDGSYDLIYHIPKCVHKSFEMPLNVVITCRFDAQGKPKPHKTKLVLFSTDLKAPYADIINYYCSRFQIEFNFRDARQYFGLSHFKNIKMQQVQNVIGYAFFMVNLSNIMLFELKQIDPNCPLSIQDLKAFFRAEKYLNELLNRVDFSQPQFLNTISLRNFPIVGAIQNAA